LRLKERNFSPPQSNSFTHHYLSELSGKGKPLDAGLKSFFEDKFGHDFSQVRIHADVRSNESAKEVNAKAYTYGHHIVFGEHQFQPETKEGQKLLAHELTHVVQQSRGIVVRKIQRLVTDEALGFRAES